jgi:hypothetical protein
MSWMCTTQAFHKVSFVSSGYRCSSLYSFWVQDTRKASKRRLETKTAQEVILCCDSYAHTSEDEDISPPAPRKWQWQQRRHDRDWMHAVDWRYTISAFCACDIQVTGVPSGFRQNEAPNIKVKFLLTECFNALFSWNYASAGGRDKQILLPVLEKLYEGHSPLLDVTIQDIYLLLPVIVWMDHY